MRIVSMIAALLFIGSGAFAQSNPGPVNPPASATPPPAATDSKPAVPPAAKSAANEKPHDAHGGMILSAEPITDNERAKDLFGKANPLPAGILPVEVTFQNQTPRAIRVNLTTVQLEVHIHDERQDVDWLTPGEVANAIVHPDGPPPPKQRRIPVIGLGIPGNDKKVEKLANILRPLTLDSDIIPPLATIHGFLYFNLSHEMTQVPNSSLYLPDAVFLPSNDPLIFFEVPLSPAAQP
jgi:hypothetical protein